jgi:hypothetical protein
LRAAGRPVGRLERNTWKRIASRNFAAIAQFPRSHFLPGVKQRRFKHVRKRNMAALSNFYRAPLTRGPRNLRCVMRTTYIAPNLLLTVRLLCLHASRVQAADDSSQDSATPPIPEERFAIHGQMTYTAQATDGFHAPYRGANSLSPASSEATVDGTLYLGAMTYHTVVEIGMMT